MTVKKLTQLQTVSTKSLHFNYQELSPSIHFKYFKQKKNPSFHAIKSKVTINLLARS